MSKSTTDEVQVDEQPFVAHLLELRDRLLKMVMAVGIVFVALFPFSNSIYTAVAKPLMAHLPAGTSMIATEVASPFLTPFKLSLVASIFLSMPFILYQFWAFVAPGLYKHEKRLITPLLVSSIALFYLGMLFAYFVVFPLVFAFLTSTAPEGVAVMTDISRYLDFVLTLFFAFGIAFEVPIATILLVWMGITTPKKLTSKRPYIIVAAFVLGMLLTPPDVISQTMLAVPVLILFELGVIFSRFFVRKTDEDEEQEQNATPAPAKPAAASAAAATETSHSAAKPAARDQIIELDDDDDEFRPLSEAEMEAELDLLEEQENDEEDASDDEEDSEEDEYDDEDDEYDDESDDEDDPITAVDRKLEQVMQYRNQHDEESARTLLYEVLAEGDESQKRVARNILQQLDQTL
ncbi:MAG: twin-arginine translocase subunit TatC [gamma proteobacterium symbiont of Bathyaustriella thionipta]|nr:twin-arginine translocase subunit TatC [gamma proteobacterium symbiont of Bathyaustriella thionipta]